MVASKSKTKVLRFVWGLIPWLVVGLVVLVVVALAGRISQERQNIEQAKKSVLKEGPPPTKVITLELMPRLFKDKINLPAEVQPMEDLEVKTEVAGQVVKVLVEEGQVVKKGQVLARLDERDYRFQLRRVQANYQWAKTEHARISALAKKKVTAKSQLDEVEAQLKDLEAQLSAARLALNRTAITAPISGRLNYLYAKAGDFLSVGKPVAQILQIDQVKVKVGVPESDVAAVFDLQTAEVVIDALGGLRVEGRKTFLSRQPRTLARLYDLELKIDNPDGRILPGMFVRVELVKRVFTGALVVPLYAVIVMDNQQVVFVEKENKVFRRPVKLGVLEGWQVQVTQGLRPQEKVVVVGHRFLEDGQTVEVLKTVQDPKEILRP